MELLVIHKQDLSFLDLVDLVVALMAVPLEILEQTDLVVELVEGVLLASLKVAQSRLSGGLRGNVLRLLAQLSKSLGRSGFARWATELVGARRRGGGAARPWR